MIKILTIIGARPQIIKAAAISRTIKNSFSSQLNEIIVHTGQHYDNNMSQIFFDELGIPVPNFNLNVGSGSHALQTASMMIELEKIMFSEKPDFVLVYGDTNSTLAASLAASKIHIPIVHVEAGLRSFNKSMPEEINRIMCDHTSTLLFTPTKQGYDNLLSEGFKISKKPFSIDMPGIFHCGDIMYDNSLYFKKVSTSNNSILNSINVVENEFVLATIHRADNTDDSNKLQEIFEAFLEIVSISPLSIIVPVHPRTLKKLENIDHTVRRKVERNSKIRLIPPVSFLDMIELESKCKMVITDSGGVQKEAYFFKKPCLILRKETEWVEIVKTGSAILSSSNFNRIIEGFNKLVNNEFSFPEIFGDGNAAEFICEKILDS